LEGFSVQPQLGLKQFIVETKLNMESHGVRKASAKLLLALNVPRVIGAGCVLDLVLVTSWNQKKCSILTRFAISEKGNEGMVGSCWINGASLAA